MIETKIQNLIINKISLKRCNYCYSEFSKNAYINDLQIWLSEKKFFKFFGGQSTTIQYKKNYTFITKANSELIIKRDKLKICTARTLGETISVEIFCDKCACALKLEIDKDSLGRM